MDRMAKDEWKKKKDLVDFLSGSNMLYWFQLRLNVQTQSPILFKIQNAQQKICFLSYQLAMPIDHAYHIY